MFDTYLKMKSNNFFQISYRNTSDHEPYLLQVPGCDAVACELDTFIHVLKPITSVDWDAECKSVAKNNVLEILGE